MGLLGLYRLAFGFREMRLIGAVTLLAAGLLARASAPLSAWGPAALASLLAWSMSEYAIHRFLLHMPRPKSPRLRSLHARLHWKHHHDPDEPALLFIPCAGTIGMFVLFGGICYALGGLHAGLGATLGLGVMLFVYETTHLAAHVHYRPRTSWGRFLKRFHRLHHYKNEHYWFGVTHPLTDLLVGTWPEHARIERSTTARTLGIEPES